MGRAARCAEHSQWICAAAIPVLGDLQGISLEVLLRIPERMRRPSAARETLRFDPLVQAGWADAPRIESVPLEAALTEPLVFLAWRPAAQWAADARRFRSGGLLLFVKLAVWNDDRIIADRSHDRYYDLVRPAMVAGLVRIPLT